MITAFPFFHLLKVSHHPDKSMFTPLICHAVYKNLQDKQTFNYLLLCYNKNIQRRLYKTRVYYPFVLQYYMTYFFSLFSITPFLQCSKRCYSTILFVDYSLIFHSFQRCFHPCFIQGKSDAASYQKKTITSQRMD